MGGKYEKPNKYYFYSRKIIVILIGCNKDSNNDYSILGNTPELSSVEKPFEPSIVQITIRTFGKPERVFQLTTVEWDGKGELMPDVAYEVGNDQIDSFRAKIAESIQAMRERGSEKKKQMSGRSQTELSAIKSGDKCVVMAFAGSGGISCISEAESECYGEKEHRHYWEWNGGAGYYYHNDPYGEWSYLQTNKNWSSSRWWARTELERYEYDYMVDIALI